MTPSDRAGLVLAADVIESLPTALTAELRRRGLNNVAAGAEMGVRRGTVSRWANGRTRPGADDLVTILRWLARGPE